MRQASVIPPVHEFLDPGSIWVRNILPDSRPARARFSAPNFRSFRVCQSDQNVSAKRDLCTGFCGCSPRFVERD